MYIFVRQVLTSKDFGHECWGYYTSIPKGSVFYCTEASLTIGKKVIFGTHPTIITGDH